jgi:GAF domain-containing protein
MRRCCSVQRQYKIYDAGDQYATMRSTPRTTRVDSDEDPTLNDDSFARFVFHRLYESQNLDATIEELLAFVGARFNVSRVYVFENNEDNTACANTFEWCNVGIRPEKERLQHLSYITDIPGWPDVFNEKGVMYCADISQLEQRYREVLEPQGIKSMLHCAIMDQGVFRGYVGFDECNTNRLWTQGQISTLEFLAEVMAVFLIKRRTQGE